MPNIPLALFEPDKSAYNAGALPEVINAVPTSDGWGPLKGTTIVYGIYYLLANEFLQPLLREDGNYITVGENFDAISGDAMLPGDAKGMAAVRRLDGTDSLFAGTQTALYLFDKVQFNWADVSGSSGPYAGDARWSFARFGQILYAQNGEDPEQQFDVDTDTEFSDNATAPIAKVIATVGDFLFRGNLAGFPARIQWSGINDPTYNVATLRLSDYQDMPTGDEVMGIVPVSGGAHIWMRSAIHAMQFAPESGFIYTRAPIDEVVGTSAPDSICLVGQNDYVVYTDNGFYRYAGGGFKNIGEGRVNKWFLSASDQNERRNILANVDPENNVVWFAYTTATGGRMTLGYHYVWDRWCLSTMAIQASCRARTFAYSSQPPILIEDSVRFAMIGDDRRLAYLVGDTVAAIFTTNQLDFAPDRSFVNSVKLQADTNNWTVTHMTTDIRGGAFRTRDAVSPSARTGRAPARGDGAQHKFRFNVAAGEPWTTAVAADVDAQRSGR